MLDIFIKTGPQKAGASQWFSKKIGAADPCRSWRGVRFNGIEQSFSSKPKRVRLDLDQPPQPTGFHYGCVVGFKDGSAQEIGPSFPANQ